MAPNNQLISIIQDELKRMHELLKTAKGRDRKWCRERLAALQNQIVGVRDINEAKTA